MAEHLSKEVRGGRKAFFANAETDSLLTMLLALMSEHSALRERVALLEARVGEKNIIDPADMTAKNIGSDLSEELAADRMRLIKTVLEAGINIEKN